MNKLNSVISYVVFVISSEYDLMEVMRGIVLLSHNVVECCFTNVFCKKERTTKIINYLMFNLIVDVIIL